VTESPTIPATAPDGDVAAVERAEAAWLEAVTAAVPHAMRRLMHPECVVVHAAAGHIDGGETFLQHTADMGRVTEIKTYDVTVQRFDGLAIVSCLQEMHVAYFPGRTPFVVQDATTRVWVLNQAGWQLVHMQLGRRQLPG
jgi:ketosteroid isomerase-like protein